ncbi:MAG: hypothetical protein IKO80_01675 [Lachnospiraceae bacterium]|nr:hypothetical protein [Lachnospiraceae bacterium]
MKMLRMLRKTAFALLLSATMIVAVTATAKADNIGVTGVVGDESTADMLHLITDGGTMLIRIDQTTDMSGCPAMTPGTELGAQVYRGADEYMHAAKLTSADAVRLAQVVVDTANLSDVQGTILGDTTSDMLHLSTSGGAMLLKIDPTSDMTYCRVLTPGKLVSAAVAYGSDAYMHAVVVWEGTGPRPATAATAVTTAAAAPAATAVANTVPSRNADLPTVSGTVDKTSDLKTLTIGTVKYLIDPDTDFNSCKAYIEGRNVTVSYYTGLDGQLHAAKVTDTSPASNATVGTAAIATVTGKITDKSKDNVLYFETPTGVMQIKLDAATNTEKTGVLYVGKSVKISVASGSDDFLHALTIVDR